MENRLKMLLIKAFGGYLQAEQWDRANDLILAGGEGGIRTLDTGFSPYNGLARHFKLKI